jgi:hypothetical protein
VIDDTLGRYRITGKLGEGGMGVVYRAHDDQLRRDLAIKLLSTKLLDDPDARARLLREACAAASLNHPNICTVYDVGDADGQIYIAMRNSFRARMQTREAMSGHSASCSTNWFQARVRSRVRLHSR